ncbi:MAG: hypothetical protein OXP28_10605 [Gammaproteobacteria bacterium]|nr:hypothetical protein [Gammaproteobacteria bacterium]
MTSGQSRRGRAKRRAPRRVPHNRPTVASLALAAHTVIESYLHPHAEAGKIWRHLPLVLALAFLARATVALSGDFTLHPDEIFQYLEPAHRLVFGNGVTYWEYFYGARAWFVPGLVAGVLKLFDLVGLGEPHWYVGGVELVFCAVSLTIPAGMYFATRSHFGETAARVALLAGAFWYELCGFAHKPMTEFVATGLLLLTLWIATRPGRIGLAAGLCGVLLTLLAAAIRLQYAPVAVVLFAIVLLRSKPRSALLLAAGALVLAVGAFDAATWDAGLFHSYVTNIRFNLAIDPLRAGESPAWQYVAWLVTAHGGLSVLCVIAAAFAPRRYALLLALVALIVGIHSLQAHKEYRFVFAAVPLLMMIGADLAVRLHRRGGWGHAGAFAAGAAFACVSAAGILNALPNQESVYRAWSKETGHVVFLGTRAGQDPIFAAYRYLADAPRVGAVWQADRPYYNTPGYYHLHRDIPLYDLHTGQRFVRMLPAAMVTHIVTTDTDAHFPDFSEERRFGTVRVLGARADTPVPRWRQHVPVLVSTGQFNLLRKTDPHTPFRPVDSGIQFEP